MTMVMVEDGGHGARVARVVMIMVITVFLTVSADHNPPHPLIIIIVAGVAI